MGDGRWEMGGVYVVTLASGSFVMNVKHDGTTIVSYHERALSLHPVLDCTETVQTNNHQYFLHIVESKQI